MLPADLRARLVGLDGVDSPVVVACSGGPDSLTLLAVSQDLALDPVAVHVDHGLRAGSGAEADVVAEHAARIGARFGAVHAPVTPGPNLEARARAARYEALDRSRRTFGASVVLTGHTADDQAETVLLNLLRGSASAGLGAMAPRRGDVVRPLLGVRRAETEAVCAELGFIPVRDPTNDDTRLRRNWIRHDALPHLSAGADRDLVPVLTRQAALLRAESEFLDELAAAGWPAGAPLASTLAALPDVLARRAVRRWLGSPPPSLADVERVLAVARGECRATELAGGRRVSRHQGRLEVARGTVLP
ncbi:MAG TPA: tRNA lysidine(34) synthetase TilS [Acidimicrobiia bacterium]|nr:tRNA lysidine(34) synthetase TilS [Acidimicrobiia bacterium]